MSELSDALIPLAIAVFTFLALAVAYLMHKMEKPHGWYY